MGPNNMFKNATVELGTVKPVQSIGEDVQTFIFDT
jgi:hypothetical protein